MSPHPFTLLSLIVILSLLLPLVGPPVTVQGQPGMATASGFPSLPASRSSLLPATDPDRARVAVATLQSALVAAPAGPGMTPADAENVEFVGQIGCLSYAVAVQGDYAYVGEGPRLTILDISNPASPTVVGKTDPLPDVVQGVAVAGGYAYVADERGGLLVLRYTGGVEPTPTPTSTFTPTPTPTATSTPTATPAHLIYLPLVLRNF